MPRIRRVAVTIAAAISISPFVAAYAAQADVTEMSVNADSGTMGLPPEMIEAMGRDLGVAATDVERVVGEQWAAAAHSEPRIRAVTGAAFAGAWWEPTGLVAAVTEPGLVDEVRAAGARAVLVSRPITTLDAIKQRLDAVPAPSGVSSWYVDLRTNTVVVEALPEALETARSFAATAESDAVRIVASTAKPRPRYDIVGGDRFNISGGYCSVGFAVTNGFVTAGHCVSPGAPTTGINGAPQGVAQAGVFPGRDYGWVATNANWVPQPYVNGYAQGRRYPVGGTTPASVGAHVCKSGARTGYYCGEIEAKNVSVNYPQGTVYGLTRTSACSAGGDSGGAFLAGVHAQGVTSGGNSDGCPGGGDTYFQPLQPILDAYGLTPVLTTVIRVSIGCETTPTQVYCTASVSGAVNPSLRWYVNGVHLSYFDDQYDIRFNCAYGVTHYYHAEVEAANGSGRSATWPIRCERDSFG